MFRRDRWNRPIVWDAWSVLCVLTSASVSANALLVRTTLIATMLIPIGASMLDNGASESSMTIRPRMCATPGAICSRTAPILVMPPLPFAKLLIGRPQL